VRVYEGIVDRGERFVLVNGKDLNPRSDLMNHSPDGFNWGYGGSGPAQLALAILADHFKHNPMDMAIARRLQDRRGGSMPPRRDIEVGEPNPPALNFGQLAVVVHQHFKGAFVAGLDMNSSWRIDSDGVREILTRMANHGIPTRFHREEPV